MKTLHRSLAILSLATTACTGTDGLNGQSVLTATQDEPAGEHCPNGGLRIDIGVDADRNGTLDEADKPTTSYLCNGSNGERGAAGVAGAVGPAGVAGPAGDAAQTPIVTVAADTTNHCGSAGGVVITTGYDRSNPADGDILDEGEAVGSPSYVCNGANGAAGEVQRVQAIAETAGTNCPAGGIAILTGFDTSTPPDDDITDPGEAFGSPMYVCNGIQGAQGVQGLQGPQGAQGAQGVQGLQGQTGATGANGAMGAAGKTSLVTTVPAGSNCANGGIGIKVGYDLSTPADGDVDDAGEQVGATTYICNGAVGPQGPQGPAGVTRSVEVASAPLANCPAGGVMLQSFLDADNDGTLDGGEATGSPTYVCNGTAGAAGTNARVTASTEPNGANCVAGGAKVETWVDANNNNTLDSGESTGITYACTDPTSFNGATPVVLASDPISSFGVNVPTGTTQILQAAQLTAPIPGMVLAIASTKAYCDTSGSGYDCAPGPNLTLAHLTIRRLGAGGQGGTSGSATLVYLVDGFESFITTTEVFAVPAGTHTFQSLGLPGATPAGSATVNYSLNELSLIFVPN